MEEIKRNKQIEKKKTIIQSAKLNMLKNGYKKTSIEGIMKNINASKGSFYNSFQNKEELLEKILDEILCENTKRNSIFFEKKMEFEERIMEGIKISFYLDEERIFNSLFLINLTNNIEALSSNIKSKMVLMKKINIQFWTKVLEEGLEELKSEEGKNIFLDYGRLIHNINFSTFRRCVLYSDGKDLYITDLKVAKNKIDSERTEKEIKFIYKIIMKILQGEKRK